MSVATRLKRVVELVAGGTPAADDPRYWADSAAAADAAPWVSISDMSDGSVVRATQRRVTAEGLRDRRLHVAPPGTLLFAMYASVGAVAELGVSAVWNQALIGLRPVTGLADRRFLRYWLLHLRPAMAGLVRSNTQDNLNAEQVGNLPFPLLPVASQRAIAEFLDTETARIDALITKKRRMVDLLDERDIALSHHVISGRGLPGPRVTARLPWIGDLPTEWPLAPVYSQFDVTLGRMLNAERAANGDMAPYIRNINVRWDHVDVGDLAEMDFPQSERAKYRLRNGDLVINEGGAGVGRAAIWRDEVEECFFQKSVLRLRPISYSSVEWMLECVRVMVDRAVPKVEGNLATIPHLPAEALRVYRLPFPPAAVQAQRLAVLADQRTRTRLLRSSIEWQIQLLQEHRQALITAAVTGELAVPGVAA